jgi:hypothetical protein
MTPSPSTAAAKPGAARATTIADDFSTAIGLDRGGARQAKGDYLRAIADLSQAIRLKLSAAN